ncbi:ATP-binding protein [Aspergillus foveolatus]|uniref:ATP-binding protein n=1 Tax=Aspergillus foveolatus TaxID=210207 RepID=UPI003CCD8245
MATTEPTQGHADSVAVASVESPAQDNPGPKDQSDYTRTLEKRLSELESRLLNIELQSKESVSKHVISGDNPESELENAAKSPSDDDAGPEPEQLPVVREIRKLNWINFANRFPDQKDAALIELLMAPPSLEDEYKKDDLFCAKVRLVSAEEAQQLMATMRERNVFRSDAYLQSVRISSMPLARELVDILGSDDDITVPLVFRRPFAPLIYHIDDFKKKLAKMEAELEKTMEEDVLSIFASSVVPTQTAMTASEKARADRITLADDFRYLIQFLEREILPFANLFDSSSKPETSSRHRKTCFRDLWHLFRVGEYIYNPAATFSFQSNPKAVVSENGDQKLWKLYRKRAVGDNFELKCYRIDHNGEAYVCIPTTFTISYFKGEQDIVNLTVYPLRFAEDHKALLQVYKESGQKCRECIEAKFLLHAGWALTPESHSSLQYIASDVILDAGEAMKLHFNWKFDSKYPSTKDWDRGYPYNLHHVFYWRFKDQKAVSSNIQNAYWVDDWVNRKEKIDYCVRVDSFLSHGIKGREKEYQLNDDDIVLLPRRLFAYVLQERRFVAVETRNLSSVKDSTSGTFENLVINPDHMSLLQSLVHSHYMRKQIQDSGRYSVNQDIVHNKGRGLVILLHGVPGVGKTSTAETIAHQWKKPLLPITYGDLGLSPSNVESKLKDVFRLAQLWGCILLLDEADVFLSERKATDLERNALVSIFLRVLEYYTGILFLTTNRVGTIDEAFRSRIHISLYYPDLGKRETRKIWKLNLDRLRAIEEERAATTGKPALTIDVDGIKNFALEHYKSNQQGKGRWNGRQIRNAFLVASALARYEKEHPDSKSQPSINTSPYNTSSYDISARHFKIVADAGVGFDQYLYEIKRKTPGEQALLHGYRIDSVTHKSPQEPGSQFTPGQGVIPPSNQGLFPGQSSPSPQGHYDGLQVHNPGSRQSQAQFSQYGYTADGLRSQPFVPHGHDPTFKPSPQMGYGQEFGMGMGMRNEYNLQPPPVTPSKHSSKGSPRGTPSGFSGTAGHGDDDSDSDD